MHEFVELLRTEWPLKTDQRMRAVFFLRELSNTRANKVHECGKSRSINNQMDVPTNSGQARLLFITHLQLNKAVTILYFLVKLFIERFDQQLLHLVAFDFIEYHWPGH